MRKISKVGVRTPSSDERSLRDSVSETRAKIENTSHFSKTCPKEVSEEIVFLAGAKVSPPSCPQGFVELVQTSSSLLKLEERSLLEEISGTQCRSLVESEQDIYLQNFVEGFEAEGPIGRRKVIVESFRSMEEDFKRLERLRASLNTVLSVNVPTERWILRNGVNVLPESDLVFFYSLVVQNGCRVDADAIDDSFRAMQTLEELRRLMPEGNSKRSLDRFMQGIHKLIDKKVGEYFLSYVGR